jgi:hypothetical protein
MKVCPIGIVMRVLYIRTCIYLFSECVEALVCTTSVCPTQNPARLMINAGFVASMEELNLTQPSLTCRRILMIFIMVRRGNISRLFIVTFQRSIIGSETYPIRTRSEVNTY